MTWISWQEYRSAHGRPSGDIIKVGEWEDIPDEDKAKYMMQEASDELVERETELDKSIITNPVTAEDWMQALLAAQQAGSSG